MLNEWLKIAERVAVALERMADAAEAKNQLEHPFMVIHPPEPIEETVDAKRVG